MTLRGALLAAVLVATPALGHGEHQWIDDQGLIDPMNGDHCCGEKDCEDLTALGIDPEEKPSHYRLPDTNEFVQKSRVLWKSPDGHWWRCYMWLNGVTHATRCLIGPSPSY